MGLGIGGDSTLGALRQSNQLQNARNKIFAKLSSGLEEGLVEVSIESRTATELLVEGVDVMDPGALAAIDAAREQVVQTRAELGPAEKRWESQNRSNHPAHCGGLEATRARARLCYPCSHARNGADEESR